jgi:hypothetical protein
VGQRREVPVDAVDLSRGSPFLGRRLTRTKTRRNCEDFKQLAGRLPSRDPITRPGHLIGPRKPQIWDVDDSGDKLVLEDRYGD